MIRFRLIFTALLFVVALFSAHGNAVGADKTDHQQGYSFTSLSSELNYEYSLKSTPFVQHTSVKHLDSQQNEPGIEPVQFRLVVSNSSLFLHPAQAEPNYIPTFEFFAPSLAKALFLQPLAPPITQPWYTVYEGRKSRLSGWKDANLLYRAVNTYHS